MLACGQQFLQTEYKQTENINSPTLCCKLHTFIIVLNCSTLVQCTKISDRTLPFQLSLLLLLLQLFLQRLLLFKSANCTRRVKALLHMNETRTTTYIAPSLLASQQILRLAHTLTPIRHFRYVTNKAFNV